MRRVAVVSAWAILGAMLTLGILLPPLTFGPRTSPIAPALALLALPILLLATFAIEARASPDGSRARVAFAIGTLHFVAWDAYMLVWWRGFDFARDVYADIITRAIFWALNVGAVWIAVGEQDLARGGYRSWILWLRGVGAAILLAFATLFAIQMRQGHYTGFVESLPLVAFFAVPIATYFGALFGAVDLGVAWLARTADRN